MAFPPIYVAVTICALVKRSGAAAQTRAASTSGQRPVVQAGLAAQAVVGCEVEIMNISRSAAPCRIFISYRHNEDGMAAGWLVERLAGHFGKDQIFKDVDSIEPGDDFVKVIADAVGRCDVLLALIGREWLTITGDDGRRRLDNPQDFVRLEIEAALKRDIRLIPVLIEGTPMPPVDQVPRSLAALVSRQALHFSAAHAEPEFDRLIKALDRTLAEVRSEVPAEAAATEPKSATPTVPVGHGADTRRKDNPAKATGNTTHTSAPPRKTSALYTTLSRRSADATRKLAARAKKSPTGERVQPPPTGDQPSQAKLTRIPIPAVDVPALAEALCQWYQDQRLKAVARPATPSGMMVQCRSRAVERVFGMGAALTVLLRHEGEDLLVEIGAAKWMGKSVGTGAGLVFHWMLIPVGIGALRQYKLPRQTINFLRMEAPKHLRSAP